MIIGIGHKTQVGKDLVTKIIQYLTFCKEENKQISYSTYEIYVNPMNYWENKKFATKLKQIVCTLTGCTIEQLEDNNFKNSKLPIEWEQTIDTYIGRKPSEIFSHSEQQILTYRELLQQLGTDLLRNQLHKNVWVNALMNEYKEHKPPKGITFDYNHSECISCKKQFSGYKKQFICNDCYDEYNWFPNWIISDVRFSDEADVIKNKGGILIKINRDTGIVNNHESEIALDNYTKWDYIIDNNGTIEELIEKVKEILIKEGII